MKSHYETLDVPKNASTETIKAAFRKLSLETHPDVAKVANAERFKQISHAASILTNPQKRRTYDSNLETASPFGSGLHRHGFDSKSRGQKGRTHPTTGMHGLFYTLFRPRNLILGPVAFFSTVAAIQYIVGRNDKSIKDSSGLVQAWKNPQTGAWEQPAPWDPVYRELKPELQFVPREQVRSRAR